MQINFIEYKGEEILLVDYTLCKSNEDIYTLQNYIFKLHTKSPEKIKTLNDFTGITCGNKFITYINKNNNLFNHATSKNAIIGISGMKKFINSFYNIFLRNKTIIFKTREDALEYLVS